VFLAITLRNYLAASGNKNGQREKALFDNKARIHECLYLKEWYTSKLCFCECEANPCFEIIRDGAG
jgi:hypothetical protein